MAGRPLPEQAFAGFGPKGLPFLKALGFHQDRDWFNENRDIYVSELREPMIALVERASERLADRPCPLRGSAKSSLFRINRDVRFSKEKHPYKTNVSAVLTRTGTKKDTGGVYMHIQPEGESFLASGLWFPPSPKLKAMRQAIVERWKDWNAVLEALGKAGLTVEGQGKLTRAPRDFTSVEDVDMLEWVKCKGFVTTKPIPDDHVTDPALLDTVVGFARDIEPFMQFVWRATDHLREEDGNA